MCHAMHEPSCRSRRADPQRIFQARRAAVRYGLMDTGMDEETANGWCDAWELEAAGLGLPRDATYWRTGEEWIAAERAARRPAWCLLAWAAGLFESADIFECFAISSPSMEW